MGDMAEEFNAMREATKERRASRLENADETGWSKHTDYHWYREINGIRLNYWPSSGLVMIGVKKHNIKNKYIRDLITKSQGE